MNNFWENAFKEKNKMWGEKPTVAAKEAASLFKDNNLSNILIPGIGYGRNAIPFLEKGQKVSGIEISETAIKYAIEKYSDSLKIFQGSVSDMPFDNNLYDGIFCHALVHLFDTKERIDFIKKCFDQLSDRGIMIFTAITKKASTFGIGIEVGKDRYKTKDGIELYFYDELSIKKEYTDYGYIECCLIQEPINNSSNLSTEFWKITCKKKKQ